MPEIDDFTSWLGSEPTETDAPEETGDVVPPAPEKRAPRPDRSQGLGTPRAGQDLSFARWAAEGTGPEWRTYPN